MTQVSEQNMLDVRKTSEWGSCTSTLVAAGSRHLLRYEQHLLKRSVYRRCYPGLQGSLHTDYRSLLDCKGKGTVVCMNDIAEEGARDSGISSD